MRIADRYPDVCGSSPAAYAVRPESAAVVNLTIRIAVRWRDAELKN